MKRNLVGKSLGKIKIFVQDFVPIRTALTVCILGYKEAKNGQRGTFVFTATLMVDDETGVYVPIVIVRQENTIG